jgi:predicted transcriptional regulator
MTDEKKAKPIDVDSIDLEKMKQYTTDIPGLIEYAHSVGSFAIAPTKKGAIKGRALKVMEQQTQMQMDKLFEQMQLLAKQAREIKDRTDISLQIYDAVIGFEPIVGDDYYLYEKKNGAKLVSLVSPKEWGNSLPFEKYIAKVKLLADHTWDVIEKPED